MSQWPCGAVGQLAEGKDMNTEAEESTMWEPLPGNTYGSQRRLSAGHSELWIVSIRDSIIIVVRFIKVNPINNPRK